MLPSTGYSTFDSQQCFVGIDIGFTSLNCVVIDERKRILHEYPYTRHFGNIEVLHSSLIEGLSGIIGKGKITAVAYTGSRGETSAIRSGSLYGRGIPVQSLGAAHVEPKVKTIISMGGRESLIIHAGSRRESDSLNIDWWKPDHLNDTGLCARASGSFIDQQAEGFCGADLTRREITSQWEIEKALSEFITLGEKSKNPAKLSCRCAVFTKSDITHLRNSGVKTEDIIYGLHLGIVRRFISPLIENGAIEGPVLFIGGQSLNSLLVKAFRQYIPDLIVPDFSTSLGALGAALLSREACLRGDTRLPRQRLFRDPGKESKVAGPRLALKKTKFPEPCEFIVSPYGKGKKTYMGIDIGSTTTKHVLIDDQKKIVHKLYLPTRGNPIKMVCRLFEGVRKDLGPHVEIAGIATTGSGREIIGSFVNAHRVVDEITAHATGAAAIDPRVDTIFEIGGQDSKFIRLANGHPVDFTMNKLCAAGTGSFLEEFADKYGINIVQEFEEIALSSNIPVSLKDQCSVIIETDLMSHYHNGAALNDLIAGLCYAVVRNYLNRVVEKRALGKRIMLLGGASLNRGMVAAFENILNQAIIVPPHREVLGAFGSAISVYEELHRKKKIKSAFRGLDSITYKGVKYEEKTCHADPDCDNECELKIYHFNGRLSVWGSECGRFETTHYHTPEENGVDFLRETLSRYRKGVVTELSGSPLMEIEGRPTVGMQSALYGHQTCIFWAYFFDCLGLRLVMTPPTDGRVNHHVDPDEATGAYECIPLKISLSHVKKIIGKTRYIFLPSLITMPTTGRRESGSCCYLIQGSPYLTKMVFGMEGESILSPVVHFKSGANTLASELFQQMGAELRVDKGMVKAAVYHALKRQDGYRKELHEKGHKIISGHSEGEPLVIVTGRPYTLHDDRLNLNLWANLARIGAKAIPMDYIDLSVIDLPSVPSVFGSAGTEILQIAGFVASQSNIFGIHLTNLNCDTDGLLERYYRLIMGDKASLILEFDEQHANTGVITRLEAFKNIIMKQ